MNRTISSRLNRRVTALRARAGLGHVLATVPPLAAGVAFMWICLRVLASLALVPVGFLIPAALVGVALVLVTTIVLVWRQIPTADEALLELDRRSGARGRLLSLTELQGRNDMFSRAAVEDGERWLDSTRTSVAALFPIRRPVRIVQSTSLVALALVSATLLSGVMIDWSGFAPRSAPDTLRADLAAIADKASLPTLAWVAEELKDLAPAPREMPAASEARATEQPEGAEFIADQEPTEVAILDPKARAFLEALTSPAMRERITQEIGTKFTGESAPQQFADFAAYAEMARDPNMSGQLMPEGNADAGLDELELDMPVLGEGADLGLKVDPTQFKQDYMADQNAISEMVGAIKESFAQYLNEFAEQVLQGLEDGMKKGITTKEQFSSGSNLPKSPMGMGTETTDTGALVASKGKPQAYVPGTPQSLGGTAAGGQGAGAGAADQAGTESPFGDGAAGGPRMDLHGTLDERLAVVDVIQRMSGGSGLGPDETALGEVVREITRDAQVEAVDADDIPLGYQDAVQLYSRSIQNISE